MAIVSSHTLNGMNGTHAGGFPVRLINISQNSEIFSSSMDNKARLEKIIDLSVTDGKDKFDKYTDTLLYLAARNEHIEKKIKPALKKRQVIICDRFILSLIHI